MKKILLWGMMMLLPAMAGAEAVKIGDLYYNLDGKAMTAEVVNEFGYTPVFHASSARFLEILKNQ